MRCFGTFTFNGVVLNISRRRLSLVSRFYPRALDHPHALPESPPLSNARRSFIDPCALSQAPSQNPVCSRSTTFNLILSMSQKHSKRAVEAFELSLSRRERNVGRSFKPSFLHFIYHQLLAQKSPAIVENLVKINNNGVIRKGAAKFLLRACSSLGPSSVSILKDFFEAGGTEQDLVYCWKVSCQNTPGPQAVRLLANHMPDGKIQM